MEDRGNSGRSAEGGGSYVVASDTLTVSIPGNGAPRVDAGSDITPLSNEKVTSGHYIGSSRKIAFDAPASASDLTFKLTVNDSQYDATDGSLSYLWEHGTNVDFSNTSRKMHSTRQHLPAILRSS